MKNSARGSVATEGITVGDAFGSRPKNRRFAYTKINRREAKTRKTRLTGKRGEERWTLTTQMRVHAAVIPRENNFICSIKSTFPFRFYPFWTRFSDHLVKLLSFPRLGSSRHLHVMHKNTILPSYALHALSERPVNCLHFINSISFFLLSTFFHCIVDTSKITPR